MRFLHTSDWHLGQNFMGKSRLAEHQAFFAWLLQQVVEQQIQAVIVAGDVFDTGAPPSYARELYNQLIIDLRGLNCQLVVLAGNHDSVAVLNESKGLVAQLSTSVITQPQQPLSEQLILLGQAQPFALLAAIPFLRARDMVTSQAGESSTDKKRSLQQAISDHYQQLFKQAQDYLAEQQLQLPIILTGHLTTLGASISESVRDIYVGNLQSFPSDAFPPADYIALGHIHRPQLVAGQQHVRYSGSPIPLSFDELATPKQVLLVECQADQVSSITPLAVPNFQPLARIAGSLPEIKQQLQAFAGQSVTTWLEIEVQQDDYLESLHSTIQALCDELPVEVLRLKRQRQSAVSLTATDHQESLAELTVEQVFARRLDQEQLAAEQRQQLIELHQSIVEELFDPDSASNPAAHDLKEQP